jgi:hypothetical protein
MTQLDNSHDLLHAKNKDRYYTQNKYINTLYSIADKLEQRISKLERVLESHAKCIGELRGTELRIHDLKEIKNDR